MLQGKLKWITVGLAVPAVFLLLFVFFRPTQIRPVPSLLGRELHFDADLVEAAWKEIAVDDGLAKVFFRDRVNRFFPDQAINCRVRRKDVSYQALLAPAGSRIELSLKAEKGDQLSFSMFNPQARPLKFMVKTGPPEKEKLLFSDTIREQIGKVEKVLLGKAGKEVIRLVLEAEGLGLGAWINPCLLRSQNRPRTVLILMLDTMRADHVSAYGYRRRTTPALDELAKGSLLFNRAFSPSPWTLPAHVSLFSGRDVLQHAVVSPESVIPGDLPLLAESMQENGFVTLALTGGGFVDDHFGFYRGFQSYNSRSDDVFQREAAGLLYNSFREDVANFSGQDLFIFLHTYQMHAPYKAPDSYFQAFNPDLDIKLQSVGSDLQALSGSLDSLHAEAAVERQKLIDLYDASILYSDQELLKPLLAFLRQSRRFDDALLVVMADHGEEFYDHGKWEHGHTLYQELTRIPLVIKLPGQKRGQVRSQLVSLCDIPDLIKGEYGLAEHTGRWLSEGASDPLRILELSLPVSPFHSSVFGKVSFVETGYQYIHNFLPAAGGASAPAPALSNDEWFTLADSPLSAGVPYSPSPAFVSRYKKMLVDYILRLKNLKKNSRQLDPELLKKLKALGYLNN